MGALPRRGRVSALRGGGRLRRRGQVLLERVGQRGGAQGGPAYRARGWDSGARKPLEGRLKKGRKFDFDMWAPDALEVLVCVDGNFAPLNGGGGGAWSGTVAPAGVGTLQLIGRSSAQGPGTYAGLFEFDVE